MSFNRSYGATGHGINRPGTSQEHCHIDQETHPHFTSFLPTSPNRDHVTTLRPSEVSSAENRNGYSTHRHREPLEQEQRLQYSNRSSLDFTALPYCIYCDNKDSDVSFPISFGEDTRTILLQDLRSSQGLLTIPLGPGLPNEVYLIRDRVTQPLLRRMTDRHNPRIEHDYTSMKVLLQMVLEADMSLYFGTLLNLRDLEFQLLHDERTKSMCPDLYATFFIHVSGLCNDVYELINLHHLSRDRSHRQTIADSPRMVGPGHRTIILGPQIPMQKGTNNGSAPRGTIRNNSISSSSNFLGTPLGTPTSIIQSFSTTMSSPEMIPGSSQGEVSNTIALARGIESSPLNQLTHGTLPLQTNQPSSTQSSQSDSTPQISCPVCFTPFTGTVRHAKQNLSRHMRNLHNRRTFSCGDENCDRSFTRKDNLREHQKKKGHSGIV